MNGIKEVIWVGSALKDLKNFPAAVMDEMGYQLHLIQMGYTPNGVKSLKGFEPSVMEIITDYNTDTFRAVYTVKLADKIYILHCFQKKAKSGIKTAKEDIDLIRQRLKNAKCICEAMRRLK